MVVLRSICIKAGLTAGMFELFDQTHPSQQVQITIYGAKAHFRQSLPNDFMEFYRCRVGFDGLQFFENDLPLPRLAALASLVTLLWRERMWPNCLVFLFRRGLAEFSLAAVHIHSENYYQ